jgi:hypothetical protein
VPYERDETETVVFNSSPTQFGAAGTLGQTINEASPFSCLSIFS